VGKTLNVITSVLPKIKEVVTNECNCLTFNAPQVGLEPTTPWLAVGLLSLLPSGWPLSKKNDICTIESIRKNVERQTSETKIDDDTYST